jgi:hypothetical protein
MTGQDRIGGQLAKPAQRASRFGRVLVHAVEEEMRAPLAGVRVERDQCVAAEQDASVGQVERATAPRVPWGVQHDRPTGNVEGFALYQGHAAREVGRQLQAATKST